MISAPKICVGSQIRAGLSGYVAELSAAILGAELGLPVAHLDHHASYIAAWLDLLKSDDRAILTAAAKAEEAASLLLRLGGMARPETTEDQSALSEAA
jgi:antirestriction protein ArdC